VIPVGAGKVLDAGQAFGPITLGLACITGPTSAATCAGLDGPGNLYSNRRRL